MSTTQVGTSAGKVLIYGATGYTFTQLRSVEVARRAVTGDVRPGFQSPTDVYGHELATSIDTTIITDL